MNLYITTKCVRKYLIFDISGRFWLQKRFHEPQCGSRKLLQRYTKVHSYITTQCVKTYLIFDTFGPFYA